MEEEQSQQVSKRTIQKQKVASVCVYCLGIILAYVGGYTGIITILMFGLLIMTFAVFPWVRTTEGE